MKESDKLPSDLSTLQRVKFMLSEENKVLKAKTQALNMEVDALSTKISSLSAKNEALSTELGFLTNKNKTLSIELNSLSAQNQQLIFTNQKLEEQLALLRAKRFGKSSEKLKREMEETELKIEENELLLGEELLGLEGIDGEPDIENSGNEVEEDSAVGEAKGEEKKRPKRQKLPDFLPREEVVLNPDSQCSACGGESFRKIGDDVSEVLEYVPSSFKVIRYVRPRCACVNCEQIVQAYAASKPIDKGKAGPGLLAHILVQKYCDHLPLYRQSEIYARERIDLSRTTMAGWAGYCAKLLEPLAEEIRKFIFAANKIHGDDTPVRVLEPGLGRTKVGRIWVYVVDGRGYGDQSPVAVCYFYSPDRKGSRPAEHLQDFRGVFQADAYAGYDRLYQDSDDENGGEGIIEEAACWAHTRRKFYEVTVANEKASIAHAVLEQIGRIYGIEEEIRGLPAEQRKEERNGRSRVLVEKLFRGLKKAYDELPKKSSTAKAIAYALNNEKALRRFLDNGQIEIDNNIAERAMRSIAVGRKNWLFAGSDNGGDTAATIYSIIETAKLNGINPWKYLRAVLEVIQDHKASKISELLPWNIILG